MINFDGAIGEKKKKKHPNSPQIPDHPYYLVVTIIYEG